MKATAHREWSSRMKACRWLGSQGAMTDEAILRANEAGKAAAGTDAGAEREQAQAEHASDTEQEIAAMQSALKKLRRIEAQARRWARPTSLAEAATFPPACCAHWPLLRDLEAAVARFEEGFRAGRPLEKRQRTKGSRASAEVAAANTRFVGAFFASLAGRSGGPRDLALSEIASGRARPCADVDEFTARLKRWSKAIRPK